MSVTIREGISLTYQDVLLEPQYLPKNPLTQNTSRRGVDLTTEIVKGYKIDIPLIASNMRSVVGRRMVRALADLGGVALYPKHFAPEDQAQRIKGLIEEGYKVIPTVGIKDSDRLRLDLLANAGAKIIVLDVAHGHQEPMEEMVRYAKDQGLKVVAGNVATKQAGSYFAAIGVDALKVGIGPGSICATREETGVGVPQLSAIMEVLEGVEKQGRSIPIWADGGIQENGDIGKAIGAGASAVVVGSMLAGTKETPGEVIEENGRKFKEYNGLTSEVEKKVQLKHHSTDKSADFENHIEGVPARVEYKGPLEPIVTRAMASLRSTITYTGHYSLEDFRGNGIFKRITPAGRAESITHIYSRGFQPS